MLGVHLCGVRVSLFAVLMAAAVPAGAQAPYGPREPLLSERAFGLAGAVTGSTAGPTAAYYNPAGLADTPGTSAGASLSVRTYRSYTLENGYTSVLGVEDLTDSGLLSVPVFVGAVLKFGDRDETNIRQHALAAGMLIRHSLDRELLIEDADLMRGIASNLEVEETSEVRWFYASYALRISNQVSVGATVALSIFDREYREAWSQATNLSGSPSGGFTGMLTTRNARIDLSSTSLAIRLGGSWRPAEWIQIGAAFQIPGIELFDSGRAFFERVTADSEGASGFFRVDDDQLDVRGTIPWQLRLGAYARFDRRFGMALDLGLTGAEGNSNEPVHPLGREISMDGDRPAATYFADRYWADVGFDAAIGAEIQLTDEIPLRVGTSFELSGMPTAVGTRETYVPDRLDRWTVTAAIGMQGDRYDFGLGVGYTYGFGSGLRPTDPLGGGYDGTNVTSHEVHFFLSGVTGAATQIALDTYRAITGSGFDEGAEAPEDALDDVEELQNEEDVREEEEEREAARRDLGDLPDWILEAIEEDPDAEADPAGEPPMEELLEAPEGESGQELPDASSEASEE